MKKMIFGLSLVLGLALNANVFAAPAATSTGGGMVADSVIFTGTGGNTAGITSGTNVMNFAFSAASGGNNNAAVINWSKFQQDAALNFAYNDGTGVLNRITDVNSIARINGAITSYTGTVAGGVYGGNVYFSAPGGIIFGNGAKINAGSFFATTANLTAVPATLDAAFYTAIGNKPYIGFEQGATALTAASGLSFGGGADKNLWLIGSVQPQADHTKDYGVGAFAANQANGPTSMATINFVASNDQGTPNDLFISSGDKKMWIGDVVAAQYDGTGTLTNAADVTLLGSQIWLPSVSAHCFYATGGNGGNGGVNWNDGVWVYGHKITPLQWPKGAGYDDEVILKAVSVVDITGHQIWISAKTVAGGDVYLGNPYAVPANPTQAAANAASNTFIIWTLDIVSGGDVQAIATGTVPQTTPWIYGLNSVPKGTGGSVWVNSVDAANDIYAAANYGVVVWNYLDKLPNGNTLVAGGDVYVNVLDTNNVMLRGKANVTGDIDIDTLDASTTLTNAEASNAQYGVYGNDNDTRSYYW